MIMLLLMLLVLVVQVKGFTVHQENKRQWLKNNNNKEAFVVVSTFQLHMSNNKNVGTGLPSQQQNEFSRTVQPDRIIKSKHNKYTMSITANTDECIALKKRFELINLDNLSADVTLQPELIGGNGRGSGIIVEGNIQASVTQRCVRSNELFDIDLNFPIYSIVRPVVPMSMMMQGDYYNDNEDYKERSYRRTEPRGGKKVTYRPNNRNIDDIDILELQRILQSEVNEEETDSLMEDESIYIKNGILDIGELIAQLFWLQLDPYPKKPGTEPIQRSITG